MTDFAKNLASICFPRTTSLYNEITNPEKWSRKAPKKGDHIRVVRAGALYAHHGIYVSDKEVIHFAGPTGDFQLSVSNVEIRKTTLKKFLNGGTLEVKEYTEEQKKDLLTPEQIVSLARESIGSTGRFFRYNIIFNNCEHFATFCTTGKYSSRQVKRVLSLTAYLNFLNNIQNT